jgi:DnaJ-class molecular chaperone
MAQDYYQILGIGRGATDNEIKAAYRRLARRHHPDLNSGDKLAEEQFKAVQAAYAVLSVSEKRYNYDRGHNRHLEEHCDTTTVARPRFSLSPGIGSYGNSTGFDVLKVLSHRIGRRSGDVEPRISQAAGVESDLEISLEESLRGGLHCVQVINCGPCPTCHGSGATGYHRCNACDGRCTRTSRRSIQLTLPPGIRDRATIRVAPRGNELETWDLPNSFYVQIKVRPHRTIRVKGDDLELDLSINRPDALFGRNVSVQTLDGPVALQIPPRAQSNQCLRLRGLGLIKNTGDRGDLYVCLKIVVPREVVMGRMRIYEQVEQLGHVVSGAEAFSH